ncbi:MAG: hypothetical protein KKD63_07305 [Proteobacteria bacterium]|nr:hypothetical protein [Desulfobulbaceae bacterium]MBU4152670.1 hypothetical protein [Pseudomonadota bacterium]
MINTLLSLRKLLQASREHQHIETAILTRFQDLIEPRYRVATPKGKANQLQYLQRNFFSSLFLSIYRAIGIPEEKRSFYGQINHCIRGLVTATDNLLDDEYKELLPLNFPEPAIRFKSVMHILCFDRILEGICRQGIKDGLIHPAQHEPLMTAIFQAMVPIGAEEALEEGGISEIITPTAILSSVHMYKGGKLLCLAFTAPLLLESKRHSLVSLAETGVYRIGMALQVIDDLTDFYQDIAAKNHNFLLSSVHHEGRADEQEQLKATLKEANQDTTTQPPVEILFPETIKRVMAQTIGEALAGFAALKETGFWYNEKQALRVIRFLFTIRGVGHLLPFFPEPGTALRLTSHLDT